MAKRLYRITVPILAMGFIADYANANATEAAMPNKTANQVTGTVVRFTAGSTSVNMPILTYIKEISRRPIFFVHGENAHSLYFSETAYEAADQPKEMMIIPGAVHTDLYDRVDVIPFDKLTTFFPANLA